MKTLLSVHSLLWLLMIGAFCCVTPKVNAGETYTHYSEWLTASEMQRVPHPYNLDFSSKPRWSYVMGIELESFLDTWHTYDNDKIMDYLKEYPEIYFRRKKSEYQQEHLTDTSSQRQQMATRCPIPLIALACRAYPLPKSLIWFAHNSFLHHHPKSASLDYYNTNNQFGIIPAFSLGGYAKNIEIKVKRGRKESHLHKKH